MFVADEPPRPLPAAEAFALPSAGRCVADGTLTFKLRRGSWARVIVRVNGRRVDAVRKSRRVTVSGLPDGRLALSVRATTHKGRRAAIERRYGTCNETAPAVAVPPGPRPRRLVRRDIEKGGGREARSGQTVEVHYVLVTWSDGSEADSSWSRDEVFEFPLGEGVVIPGFEQGIIGMRVGGRREIIVPPRLGYGSAGSPPTIDPNETLIFVVDVVSVR
jgi:FKBP-type peptidyl-prolyl cis-trans isomerase